MTIVLTCNFMKRCFWDVLVLLLAPAGIRQPCCTPHNHRRGADLYRVRHWRRDAITERHWGVYVYPFQFSFSILIVISDISVKSLQHRQQNVISLPLYRNSRRPGVVSSPPCLSTPSLWPTSAAAGPSICSSSASQHILRKSSASPSARLAVPQFHPLNWCCEASGTETDHRLLYGFLCTGGTSVCCAPHGDDNYSSYWRTAGRLLTQQQNHVHHKCEENHELWRYVRMFCHLLFIWFWFPHYI